MYETRLSSQATKFFRKLEFEVQERIKLKFKELEIEPFRFLEHYEGDYYKLRIGDYRALIDIDYLK